MASPNVVVYGLCTEGYDLACEMVLKGAKVYIVDESNQSAMLLAQEIAKTYPNLHSIKDDEIILPLVSIKEAVSKAQYIFFSPRIRKVGQDLRTEIHFKFKGATTNIAKNASIVYCIPAGIGGNNENISLLEHITGFEVGKTLFYFYYPLGGLQQNPKTMGSFNGRSDPILTNLLTTDKKKIPIVTLQSSEITHAIDTLSQFTRLSSILEICKTMQGEQMEPDDYLGSHSEIYLGSMVEKLYDLRSLNSSLEGAGTLTSMINCNVKCIDMYIKRLVDKIRSTLKKNDLKASRTLVAISWTLDKYEMRGDKIEFFEKFQERLRDYIRDVDTYNEPYADTFDGTKTIIVVACTKDDYEKIQREKKDPYMILIKANPMCEIVE
ncbi:MAG: hypothetical protein K8823_1351 [Cenarchaeum symbiont of Oopsacas minuta]|nr:hypothetical protein [Cenarchaeum symbiont of Oopsacas minuta]